MKKPDTVSRDTEELRSRLAAIVASSDDAIISKSLDGVIITWNEGATRIFGYTAEEVIGKPITILIPPDRLDEEPAILARLRAGERVDHFETLRVRKDGSARQHFVDHFPDQKRERRDHRRFEDRTRHHAAEDAQETLRVTNERFRMMADSRARADLDRRQHERRSWFNKGWLDFTGRAPEQEQGFGWTQNVHEDDLARCLQVYAEGFDTRQPFRSEYRIRRADGMARGSSSRPLRCSRGRPARSSGYIGSLRRHHGGEADSRPNAKKR